MHCLDCKGKQSMTERGFHVKECQITGRVLIQYIKVFFDFLFGFIIFLYHGFDSLKKKKG